MKRLIAFLLLIALLLTGCGQSSESAGTESTAPSSTAPSVTRPERQPTAGGATVKTDYSSYAPHEAQGPKYTRLSDEYISELHPSEDYGAIYPFVGNVLYADDSYEVPIGCTYGLADENGRIIVDPVYSDVSVLCDADGTPLPFWWLECTRRSNGGAVEYYGLASLDGSFAAECIYSHIFVNDGHILLTGTENGTTLFTLLDESGREVFSSEQLSLPSALADSPYGFSYGDGVLTVCCKDDTQAWNRFASLEFSYTYYYVDLEGKLLCGPFRYAQPFSDGYGLVYTPEGAYAFVDRSGNYLNGTYSYASSFHNGKAIVEIAEEDSYTDFLIDTQGNILLSSNNGAIWEVEDGFALYDVETERTSYYGWDCSLCFIAPAGWERLEGTDWCLLHTYDSKILVRNIFTGEEHTISADGINAYTTDGGVVFVAYTLEDESSHCHIMDSNFQEIASCEADAFSQVRNQLGGENCFAVLYGDSWQLLHGDLTPLDGLPASQDLLPLLFGDRISLGTQQGCAWYSLSGELLFYYPFLGSMDD